MGWYIGGYCCMSHHVRTGKWLAGTGSLGQLSFLYLNSKDNRDPATEHHKLRTCSCGYLNQKLPAVQVMRFSVLMRHRRSLYAIWYFSQQLIHRRLDRRAYKYLAMPQTASNIRVCSRLYQASICEGIVAIHSGRHALASVQCDSPPCLSCFLNGIT